MDLQCASSAPAPRLNFSFQSLSLWFVLEAEAVQLTWVDYCAMPPVGRLVWKECWNTNSSTTSNTLVILWTLSVHHIKRAGSSFEFQLSITLTVISISRTGCLDFICMFDFGSLFNLKDHQSLCGDDDKNNNRWNSRIMLIAQGGERGGTLFLFMSELLKQSRLSKACLT